MDGSFEVSGSSLLVKGKRSFPYWNLKRFWTHARKKMKNSLKGLSELLKIDVQESGENGMTQHGTVLGGK